MTHVSEQAKDLGFTVLEDAISKTFTNGDSNPYWHYLSVLQAVHATELLTKAKIAEECKCLIHQKDKEGKTKETTIGYSQLPDALKQLGKLDGKQYVIPNKPLFKEIGRIRNEIQHLRLPESACDLHKMTVEFMFSVIDPLIRDFWDDSVFNYVSTEIDYLDKFIFSDLYMLDIECKVIPASLKETAELAKTQIEKHKKVINLVSETCRNDLAKLTVHRDEILEKMQRNFDMTTEEAEKSLKARCEFLQNGWPDWTWWI